MYKLIVLIFMQIPVYHALILHIRIIGSRLVLLLVFLWVVCVEGVTASVYIYLIKSRMCMFVNVCPSRY